MISRETSGLYGPQKGKVGWRGYLSPKSGSPASILGGPAIYSKKAKRFFFPLFMLVMVRMLFSSIFKVACFKRNALFFFFSLPFCWILVGNFPRIQVVQRDYLNPTLGSPTGLFLEFRSPGRWDYAICWALNFCNFFWGEMSIRALPTTLWIILQIHECRIPVIFRSIICQDRRSPGMN